MTVNLLLSGTVGFIFGCEDHDFPTSFLGARSLELSATLQNTRQCICSDWKMLENQWANLYKQILIKKSQGILSKYFFVQKKALKFELLFYYLL